ncbi:MAG: type II secretion system protein [Planctomycetes bacterium]|nr:type II secretion system protein [Planctomycetota bacterium]
MKRAFTVIEIIVAVSILGILAAIILPMLGSSVQAKETAAREALRIMRSQIELYRFEHKGLVPGYKNVIQATSAELVNQFTGTTTIAGLVSASKIPAGSYIYGPYVQKLPVNPFNKLSTIKFVPSATAFSAAADKTTGWLYKKETAEFKLNWTGTDATGKAYTDY